MEQEDAFKVGWAGVVENKHHEERDAGEGAESISPSCLGRLDMAPQVETALNAPQLGTKMLGLGSAVLQGAGSLQADRLQHPCCPPDKEMLWFAPSYQAKVAGRMPHLMIKKLFFLPFYLALTLLLLQEPSGAEAPRSPRPFSPRWKRGRYFFRRVTSLWHQLPHVLQRSLAVCSVCMQAPIIFLASSGIKSSDKN